LKQRTPARVNTVIGLAIGTALLLYIVVAAFGYSTYGSEVESDILVNYPGQFYVSKPSPAIVSKLTRLTRNGPDEHRATICVSVGGVFLPTTGTPCSQVHSHSDGHP
jgi:hypothetical protein